MGDCLRAREGRGIHAVRRQDQGGVRYLFLRIGGPTKIGKKEEF